MSAHRVDYAESIGWVAEMGEVARQDRVIGFAERRCELFNGSKSHVNVTEAEEAHVGGSSCRPVLLQRRLTEPGSCPTDLMPRQEVQALLPLPRSNLAGRWSQGYLQAVVPCVGQPRDHEE